MKQTILCGLCIVFACQIVAKDIVREHYVTFPKDQYEINVTEAEKLQAFLSSCEFELIHTVLLEGHTDSDGSSAYNQELSKNRVEFIERFMSAYGVATNRKESNYFGESEPVASNASAQGMAENRRVRILFKAEYFEDVSKVDSEIVDFYSEEFKLSNEVPQLISTSSGVKVHIPASSFKDSQGRTVDNVKIEIKEALLPISFAANQLSTESDKGMLISGGMIKISATGTSGEKLTLDDSAVLSIAIPDDQRQEGMAIFRTSDDGGTWFESEEELLESDTPMELAPRRPRLNIPYYRAIAFEEPKKPYEPYYPRVPIQPLHPDESEYSTKITIFNFPWKKKIQKRDEFKWGIALRKFNRKNDRYERKMRRFSAMNATYPDEMCEYEDAIANWNSVRIQAYKTHKDSILPAHFEAFQRSIEPLQTRYQEEYSIWQKAYAEWADEYAVSVNELELPEGNDLDFYVFQANQMGWVNIDRFMKYPPNTLHEVIAYSPLEEKKDGKEERVFMLLNDGRSLVSLNRQKDEYTLSSFPKKEVSELVAYTVIDGRIHMYNEVFVGKNEFEIDYKPSSLKELRAYLGDSFELVEL